MNVPRERSIPELFADRDLMNAAMARGVRDALVRHAQAGNPVAISRNGEVVWVSAAELLVDYPVLPDTGSGKSD